MPQLKKLLLTTDPYGGVATFVTALLPHLVKEYQVKIVAVGRCNIPLTLVQVAADHDVELIPVREALEWMPGEEESVAEAEDIVEGLAYKYQPDVVHINSYGFAKVAEQYPTVLTLHSDLYTWFDNVEGSLPKGHQQAYKSLVEDSIYYSSAVVAPTQRYLAEASQFYKNLDKAVVVYNGIDTSDANLAEKEDMVLAAGRLGDASKGLKYLIEAAEAGCFSLWLVGSLPTDIHLPEKVKACGQVTAERLYMLMSRAAVYALPALYEPFGYSYLEAASRGCALVGFSLSTLQEIWGDSMKYTQQRDARVLAHDITQLLEDKAALLGMQKLAKERSMLYPAHAMASSYMKIYNNISR